MFGFSHADAADKREAVSSSQDRPEKVKAMEVSRQMGEACWQVWRMMAGSSGAFAIDTCV
jgi:hypothetical protein